ncbi:MAG TPA: M20/M25/M40 family metallo-hydrolase [Mycobacteriales bacterium]|nr:M20/M25/M40 family metallo-hydrolase [Mycobacteriales bacterium]
MVVGDAVAVGLLRGMVEIPSPSYDEVHLAADLVRRMRELGLRAHVDEAGNAIGTVTRGDGPTIMLLGHLDTIPGQLPVRSMDGRLYGRGAVDAKGPLAAMVCAAAGADAFRGRIVVVGAVEEETPRSRGAVAVRTGHDRPDALIVGEPSGWSTVVLGYKGKLDLRLRVRCPATHPSNPCPKASELAAAVWQDAVALLGPDASHAAFNRAAATLVSVHGDTTEAELDLTVRTPPGFDAGGYLGALRSRLPRSGQGEAELQVLNFVAACRTDRRDPAVRALSAGIRSQQGLPRMKVKTATSDMNTLAEAWAIPMATYGPGDSALDHSDDEHIVLADYFHGISVLTAALTELNDLTTTA